MLCVAVFLVFFLCQSCTEQIGVKYRCNDSSIDPDVWYSTFTPSLDGVRGRYTAELCMFNKPDRTSLTMDLTYNDNFSLCDPKFIKKRRRPVKPGPQHSFNTVNVSGLANCSHVCYAMDFDLIFDSCYLLKSTMNGKNSYSPFDSYYLVSNNVTKEEYDKTAPYVDFVNHDNYFTLTWILGIPAVDYNVKLTMINNDTGAYLREASDVTQNCTLLADVRRMRCELAPDYGCYQLMLEHGGLWTGGVFHVKKLVNYDHLCHLAATPPRVELRSAALWWACGAALLGACALLAAVLLRRQLDIRYWHKLWKDFWLNNRFREADTEPVATRDSRDVLLLYAREGELGQQAMAALRDLIQHSTGGKVYDVFAPAVLAQCGAAPAAWLRAQLAAPHVRVLLVQSPATAALYRERLCDDSDGLTLGSPLLGRRAMYRAPHYGDQLLGLALRHVAECAGAHQHYQKYYLATYQGLETDILPQVVAYRRYLLPDAARVLATNLSCVEPDDSKLLELSRAVHALLVHVQQNPNYLMDEIFIN